METFTFNYWVEFFNFYWKIYQIETPTSLHVAWMINCIVSVDVDTNEQIAIRQTRELVKCKPLKRSKNSKIVFLFKILEIYQGRAQKKRREFVFYVEGRLFVWKYWLKIISKIRIDHYNVLNIISTNQNWPAEYLFGPKNLRTPYNYEWHFR
jgi:hypothetical protein